jgi:starvation-inducible DNA-binding protein
MATASNATHLPPLGTHVREDVGNHLQDTLVELIDLSLLGKQLHWSVVGPHFKPVHEQLDELIDSWRAMADTVAERAVAIGYMPDGQAQALSASKLAPIERGELEDHLVVRELTVRLADVTERLRERLERLGELDLASQDVGIEVLRELEKQLWMVRAQFGQRA